MREQISTTGDDRDQVDLAGVFRSWMRRRLFRTACISLFLTGISAIGLREASVHAQPQLTAPAAPTAEMQVNPVDVEPSSLPCVASNPQPSASIAAAPPVAAAYAQSETVASAPLVAAQIAQPQAAASSPQKAKEDVYQVDEIRRETIPYSKVIQLSRDEDAGQAKIVSWGENGTVEKTYRITYRGNQPVSYDLIHSKVIKQPVDTVVLAGYTPRGARALPSRSGTYTRTREIDMLATGYSPYEGSGQGLCATGIRAGFGVVAVDPRVIPLGSKLYIDGYGYALAGDTGGAIRGNRIDLGLNSYRQASDVGRRMVHVYVLSEGR